MLYKRLRNFQGFQLFAWWTTAFMLIAYAICDISTSQHEQPLLIIMSVITLGFTASTTIQAILSREVTHEIQTDKHNIFFVLEIGQAHHLKGKTSRKKQEVFIKDQLDRALKEAIKDSGNDSKAISYKDMLRYFHSYWGTNKVKVTMTVSPKK